MNLRYKNLFLIEFLLIVLLFFFLQKEFLQTQEKKEYRGCTCVWLNFTYGGVDNNLSTTSDIKVLEGIEQTDKCEQAKELCHIRNRKALLYTDCENEGKEHCGKILNKASDDFTKALNKLKKKK